MADPLIAIIGSVQPARAEKLRLKNAAIAGQAAEAMGRALAKQKCRLLVYSDADLAVESLVIKGYVTECNENAALKAASDRIEVHYSTGDEAPHFPEQDTNDHLFVPRPNKNPSWASAFYRSLSQADGAILFGGSETTYIAGTVALSHRKPVLPMATFGGAAENIWNELAPEPGILEQKEIDQMASPKWSLQLADTLVKDLLLRLQRQSEQQQRGQISQQRRRAVRHVYIAVPFLVLALAPVPFTWDNPSLQRAWLLGLLLLAPLLAGIAGATARTAFEAASGNVSQEPPDLARTVGLGAIAGGIAGALFIIAQLVAMSPEVEQAVWSKQAGRLVPFAAIIGFIGGLTLDAVFRKLSGMNVISDELLKTLMSERVKGPRE